MITPILDARNLQLTFGERRGTPRVVAVNDVSFSIQNGETLGLVGESGSGKSTVGRILLGLQRADSGSVLVDGIDRPTHARGRRARLAQARQIQMVFQDPYGSLNRRLSVGATLAHALRLHRIVPREAEQAEVQSLLTKVGLDPELARSVPGRLSGGQRQRVAIARALALRPQVVVMDEALSALDVSVQAQIITLLRDIQAESGIGILFISHDLAVTSEIARRVLVMKKGKIVEQGEVAAVFAHPAHPYTRLLLDSVPREGWDPHAVVEQRRAADSA